MSKWNKYLSGLILVSLFAGLMVVWLNSNHSIFRTLPLTPETPTHPGNDWVVWENTPDGVVARQVHPLITGNPLLEGRYIEEGDLLRKLDFEPVYDAEVVDQKVRWAGPGTVLLFQVERANTISGGRQWESLFVEVSFDPALSLTESRWLWGVFPWIIVLGTFLSLVSLFILFPIVKGRFSTAWPLLTVIFVSFLLFLSVLLRHLGLLVRTNWTNLNSEILFLCAASIFILLLGMVAVRSRLRGWWRLGLLPSLLFSGLHLYELWQYWDTPEFFFFHHTIQFRLIGYLLLHVGAMLVLSVVENPKAIGWRGRSRIDRLFHALAILYVFPLLFLLFIKGLPGGAEGEWLYFAAMSTVLIPMVSATASQLKFGRVSVVLTGSLLYTVFAGLLLLAYYLMDAGLESLGLQFKYQDYAEIILLIVVALVLRWIYRLNSDRLRKYFVLAAQQRRVRIDRFIARIPQYTSSARLLEDVQEELKAYFGTQEVTVWMAGGTIDGVDALALERIHENLIEDQSFWAAYRQMNEHTLPASLEQPLFRAGIAFVSPISVNEDIYGLLLLGGKSRGVYNLEDIEVTSLLVQQTQLTLGVLHLLEREKLLLEKNYEANLTALRSQINPHFLFNTLNTISALIHDAPDDAEEAVEKLAFIFRYTLKKSNRALVPLKDELTLVRTYLEIEQIRFGARLEVRISVEPGMEEIEIPAFVVQTIVENCIKHGIAHIMEKGLVTILAKKEGDFLRIDIEDNGPGIDKANITTSTGLNNIMTRLEQIYSQKELLLFENTGHGTLVSIKIPLNV